MQQFIPHCKLSKKKKKELNLAKRRSWGDISPVTRKTESKKIYNRKKALMFEKSTFGLFSA